MNNEKRSVKRQRIIYLCFSTLALLFLGLIYAFSMFSTPMSTTFGLAKSDVGLTFNIMMVTFCLGNICGSQLAKRIGLRLTVAIAAILFFVGFAGTGVFAYGNLWAIYIFYGVLGGWGVGMGYNTLVSMTNAWFPDCIGLSSGVLMMGFGLGSLIMGTISVNLATVFGLSAVLVAVGLVACVVVILLALVLKEPSREVMEMLSTTTHVSAEDDPADAETMIKSPLFYVYVAWAIIGLTIGLATIGSCSSDAQMVGVEAGFATLLVGLVSSCNGLSRVVIGAIYDRANVKITMVINGIVALAATLCIIGAFVLTQPALYIAGALLCGFCYGGVPVVNSAFAREGYGQKKYAFNLSIMTAPIMVGSILNVIIQVAVGGADQRFEVFCVLAVLAVIALIVVVPFAKLFDAHMGKLEAARAEK